LSPILVEDVRDVSRVSNLVTIS